MAPPDVDVNCPRCGSFLVLPDGMCAACGAAVPRALEHEPTIIVPDAVEVISGWRAWGVDPETPEGDPVLLWSVTHSSLCWPPREEVVARCIKHQKHRGNLGTDTHPVPSEKCSCGLYAARTLEHLLSMSYHQYDAERKGYYHVVGEVAMWGGFIEGTQGWRAEKAYPTCLYLPFEAWRLGPRLAETYGLEMGVGIRLKNTLGYKLERQDKEA